MLGWSVYDVQVRVWLQSFPAKQLLLAYTEALDKEPQAVLAAIERHVGIDPIVYKNAHQKSNVAGCYGWKAKEGSCKDGKTAQFRKEEREKLSARERYPPPPPPRFHLALAWHVVV